jgi:ribosomal protein S18 acetylase RimI-like enzyme
MPYEIVPLHADLFPAFKAYLNDHLSDNGAGTTPLFQPLARADCHFPDDRAETFKRALAEATDGAAWRRAWVAITPQGSLVGHVDLRSHALPYMSHRCLLGMGVDRIQRRAGLGGRLIQVAMAWAIEQDWLDWIDLQVISSNTAAANLYRKSGFIQTGATSDLFRFDGCSVGLDSMALRLRLPQQG